MGRRKPAELSLGHMLGAIGKKKDAKIRYTFRPEEGRDSVKNVLLPS